MNERPHILLCPPEYFDITYVINPWMQGNVGHVDLAAAQAQWRAFCDALGQVARVERIEPAPGLPDMTFAANGALAAEGRAVISRFRFPQRQGEALHYRRWLMSRGFEIHDLPENVFFEGQGDALPDAARGVIWMGYGPRTSLEAAAELGRVFGREVAPLGLVDKRFYHLDTCFAPLARGAVVYYPEAFDPGSLEEIRARVEEKWRVEVSAADAARLACNIVEAGDTLFLNACSEALRERLEGFGYRVAETPLPQFVKSGGAGRCLTLRLDWPLGPAAPAAPRIVTREVELRGHLLDRGVMAAALDAIAERGGGFEVAEFSAGARKENVSRARIRVTARDPERMEAILHDLLNHGARPLDEEASARLRPAPADGVAPGDFYAATIHPTEIRVDGRWIRCEAQRRETVVVVTRAAESGEPRARCRPLHELRAGDLVVTGAAGVRLRMAAEQEESRATEDQVFAPPLIASERHIEQAIERIAWEMSRIREREGRTLIAAGAPVAGAGALETLAALARLGYTQAALSGNELALLDVQCALYGYASISAAAESEWSQRPRMAALNQIRGAGGLREAVERGVLRAGWLKTLIECGIPYILVGSARDTAPLPGALTDTLEAQNRFAELLAEADLALVLASRGLAEAVDALAPAGVRLVLVDHDPGPGLRLRGRGAQEAVRLVTDAGLFLKLLLERLKAFESAAA